MKLKNEHTDITVLPEFKAIAPLWADWIQQMMAAQIRDHSENHGAFQNGSIQGWIHGRDVGIALGNLISAWRWADAFEIDHDALRETIRLAAEFLVKRQRHDGQLDLGCFYSPNVAGFVTTPLARGYKRLLEDVPGDSDILLPIEQFLKRAADAIVAGSAYTANHRWIAACAPLAVVYSIWPEQRYLDKIEDYLSDGIDCNDEGCWYEERSSNYDDVANDGLLTLIEILGRKDLEKHVIRNGYFMLEMIQPNGELDTSFSRRQDRHQGNTFSMRYWLARRLAQMTGDGVFTTVAESILKDNSYSPNEIGQPLLYQLEEHPGPLPAAVPLESIKKLRKCYPDTGIFRLREKDCALTLAVDKGGHYYDTVCDSLGGVKKSEDWFHLHHKDIVIQSIHLAAGGSGLAQPTEMEVSDDVITMRGEKKGWTFPLHFRKGSPLWEMAQNTSNQIMVKLNNGKITLNLQAESKQAIAGVLAFYVRPGAFMSEAGQEQELLAGQRYKIQGGEELVLRGQSGACIRLGGLPQADHHFPVFPPISIPSKIREDCACLYWGYRLPVGVQLDFNLA